MEIKHTPTAAEVTEAIFNDKDFPANSADDTKRIMTRYIDKAIHAARANTCNTNDDLVEALKQAKVFISDCIEGAWDIDCNGTAYPERIKSDVTAALTKAGAQQ